MPIDPKHRALVAEVERTTGLDVRSVDEKGIAPLANGECHMCGIPVQFVFLSWCDECMDVAKAWSDRTGKSVLSYCREVLGHQHGR